MGRRDDADGIVQKVQAAFSDPRSAAAGSKLYVPTHHSLKGRPGRGHTISQVTGKVPGHGLWPAFTQLYSPVVAAICSVRAFYSSADALSDFLQSLLYPKHSFW